MHISWYMHISIHPYTQKTTPAISPDDGYSQMMTSRDQVQSWGLTDIIFYLVCPASSNTNTSIFRACKRPSAPGSTSQSGPRLHVSQDGQRAAKDSPGAFQREPKGPKGHPKGAQGLPKEAQGNQSRPKDAKGSPKTSNGSQREHIYIYIYYIYIYIHTHKNNSRSTAQAEVMLFYPVCPASSNTNTSIFWACKRPSAPSSTSQSCPSVSNFTNSAPLPRGKSSVNFIGPHVCGTNTVAHMLPYMVARMPHIWYHIC